MKYLLAIVLLTMSISANAGNTYETSIRADVICKEGYKFLIVWAESGSWRPPSVVQIYKNGGGATRPPQPIECK